MNTADHNQMGPAPFILPKEPKKAVKTMIAVIEDLKSIYISETEALDATDPKAFMALQDAKIQATTRYEVGVAQILARKEEMKTVEPSLKERLRALQNEFSTLCHKNLKALERMQKCTERLGDIIRTAAKEAVQKQQTLNYSARGSIENHSKKSISMGLSETA